MEQTQPKLPYPTVGKGKDEGAVNLIAPFYAGKRGELACVSQCLYQSICLSAEGKEFAADALNRIAEEDALHFQLLGKTILQLGVDPVLSVAPPKKRRWFDTSKIALVRQPAAMVLETLMFKRHTAKAYTAVASRIQNQDVQHLLLRLVLDEKKHANALAEVYRTLCK